jgi:hypothetical protein
MVRHAGPKADRCECTRLDNGTEAFLLVTYQEEYHTATSTFPNFAMTINFSWHTPLTL